nr:MAG TPA: hypothetical protein [Caudoviricetes sp.]
MPYYDNKTNSIRFKARPFLFLKQRKNWERVILQFYQFHQ